jgi:DNA-binding MarR family transcriptional regulator
MKPVKKKSTTELWRAPALGPCACSQLRRAARAVSALYDEFLALAGLTVTQYSLLVNIAREGAIARTPLAARLGMDRTTLTRNLQPLERDGLVAETPARDRRQRLLSLTAAGRRRLTKGCRQWTLAQQAFLARLGADRVAELRNLLLAVGEAAAAPRDEPSYAASVSPRRSRR